MLLNRFLIPRAARPDAVLPAGQKTVIHQHRAYRRLQGESTAYYIFKFLLLSVPFILAACCSVSALSYVYSVAARAILAVPGTNEITLISRRFWYFGDLHLVNFLGKYPTPSFSFALAVVSLLLLLLLQKIRRIPRSIAVYCGFVFFVNFVSALYFLLFPNSFPYDVTDFSDLYMKTEMGIWLMVPFIAAISLMPLPSALWKQFLLVASLLVYSVAFGFVRYIVFLYCLQHFSYVFMATMFIAFVPPLDTIYIVGIYSLYVSSVSKRINRGKRL
jgi:hypothetical protein